MSEETIPMPAKIGPETKDPAWERDDIMIALRSAVHSFVAVCDIGALGQISALVYPVNAFALALLEPPQQQAMIVLILAYANALRFDRERLEKADPPEGS